MAWVAQTFINVLGAAMPTPACSTVARELVDWDLFMPGRIAGRLEARTAVLARVGEALVDILYTVVSMPTGRAVTIVDVDWQ